ncbi:MAG: helix-turn-helix transcriptional regulator [Kiritimatiellales bacterium]|nr:helix-turn-helix transcriptional regulator [Kiritimatiellales bacterium]
MRYPELEEPVDYFTGMGQHQLSTPTHILLFMRASKETLQQAALQNRSHHRFVLTFNLETPGQVHVDNRSLAFRPGQTLLILPYQFHHFSQLASPKLHWLFCTFELKTAAFLEPLRNRVLETSDITQQALDALLAEWQKADVQEEVLQVTLMRLLLALKEVGESTDTSRPTEPRDSLLRTVNRLMSEWRGRTVVVGDLAKELNLSESRLRTLFKEAAGIPLGAYVQNYRLNRAMALLRTTSLPIAEIAEEAGFGSPQAFSRIFKKETGKTPRGYRQ